MARLYVGSSGFSYASWKPAFYPAGTKAADFLRGTPLKPGARFS